MSNLIEVSEANPCPHCGKPDWCYFLGELSVCKREEPPAEGWFKTKRQDDDGTFFYAPKKKGTYRDERLTWLYTDRKNSLVCRVVRENYSEGRRVKGKLVFRRIWQERKTDEGWKAGLRGVKREDIPVYQYQRVRENLNQNPHPQQIFIVEGESCADALNALGLIATTNIGGSGKWKDSDSQDLKSAREIVLCPDMDKPGVKHMEAVYKSVNKLETAEVSWLYAFPESPLWHPSNLPPAGGRDVADWVRDFKLTADDIVRAITDKKGTQTTLLESAQQPRKSKKMRLFSIIRNLWGEHLAFNELTKRIELRGNPLELEHLDFTIALELDLDISKENAVSVCSVLAKSNCYHPVRRYLEKVAEVHPNPSIDLNSLAARYFGTDHPLHNSFLKKHLIASVARVFVPGCKHDAALILQGRQGIRKSTFFSVLYSRQFFCDTMSRVSDRDELMKLHSCWCLEWAELETIFSRKDISVVKAFMSSTDDSFRLPYARENTTFKRSFVLVGSTNQDGFLNDPTGSRRFWVIPVGGLIDCELLSVERDEIWAAAVVAFKAGEGWNLNTREEELTQHINTQEYQCPDVWEEYLAEFIQDKTFVTNTQLLNQALQLDTIHQDKKVQMRVASCLRNLGWEPCRQRVEGKLVRGWKQKIYKFEEGDGLTVTQGSTPDTVRVTAPLDQVSRAVTDPGRKGLKPDGAKGSARDDPRESQAKMQEVGGDGTFAIKKKGSAQAQNLALRMFQLSRPLSVTV